MYQKCLVCASLINPEVMLPQSEFEAAIAHRKGWMYDSWSCFGEVPQKYVLNGCEVQVDWAINEKNLTRPRDALDDADWDAVYQQEYEDEDEMPALEKLSL